MAYFRNKEELLRAVDELHSDFNKRWSEKDIDRSLHSLADMAADMERPNFWDDQDRARDISTQKSNLERTILPWKTLKGELNDFPDLVDLTLEESADVKDAVASLEEDYNRLAAEFERLLLQDALSGPDDDHNAIIHISSGAGGTESQDWASMLLRMYTRWFEKKGYTAELVDIQDGEEAGVKSATLLVKGENVFGHLKSENGVHRLVRISPFDSNKRRHTSFASVHITPEIDDDIDIQINDKDLRTDTYRASGAGGQHINKTDSAIRITHIPSGIVVSCQMERSQHKNRDTAMKMLRARLYEMEQQKIKEDIESRSGEKSDVAWGSQIRSYVFHPYKMVKDLRTDYETGDVNSVMDGDLDPFVDAFLKSLLGLGKKTEAAKEA
jgi:peptide chain release factor 2